MHNTTIIELSGKKIEVDTEMAPLIEELNCIGLRTANCCQGTRGMAYVSIQLDEDSHFEYFPEKNILTIRWHRPEQKGKFMPVESFIHTKTGILKISEILAKEGKEVKS